ncbi:MAG: gfo/Idh/MocA family oxidoreductase [Bacteroidetes bacterium]|nr:MAG: gfo/Idh/MocA family oxidoreductase [Bacteroidota bacterium]
MRSALFLPILAWLMALLPSPIDTPPAPLRVGIAGLSHDHAHGIFNRADAGEIEIVGIAEANQALAGRYARQYGLPESLFFPDLESLIAAREPQAVAAFNAIAAHRAVVEACAPRGIHVMVEKPLATTYADAQAMAALARQHDIHLLTNYETTWYPSHWAQYETRAQLGPIRKMVVHDGHQGPREIGCSEEFLAWLTDPAQNGAGALFDFGCYGANLMTWFMESQKPLSVTAVTQQIKPDIYPRVDDEATIILTYPGAQGIIQASWNWPYNRKDAFVYGRDGYCHALDRSRLEQRLPDQAATTLQTEAIPRGQTEAFAYLAAVVRGEIDPAGSRSSLDNNLLVVQILDAARRSAAAGETISLE